MDEANLPTAPASAPEAAGDPTACRYFSVRGLARRWGVSPAVAGAATRRDDFPLSLDLGPRSQRWLIADVEGWEREHHRRPVDEAFLEHRPRRRVWVTPAGVAPPAPKRQRQDHDPAA